METKKLCTFTSSPTQGVRLLMVKFFSNDNHIYTKVSFGVSGIRVRQTDSEDSWYHIYTLMLNSVLKTQSMKSEYNLRKYSSFYFSIDF